jgi:hypothetical protein
MDGGTCLVVAAIVSVFLSVLAGFRCKKLFDLICPTFSGQLLRADAISFACVDRVAGVRGGAKEIETLSFMDASVGDR